MKSKIFSRPLAWMLAGSGFTLLLILLPSFIPSSAAPAFCRPDVANAQNNTCGEYQTQASDYATLAADNENQWANYYNLYNETYTRLSGNEAIYYTSATSAAKYREGKDNLYDCGNGMLQRLWVGAEAKSVGALPSTLRDAPGGERQAFDDGSAIEILGNVHVVGGPECTDDGISWWYVSLNFSYQTAGRLLDGWVSEGNNGEYFLGPLDWDGIPMEDPTTFDSGLGFEMGSGG